MRLAKVWNPRLRGPRWIWTAIAAVVLAAVAGTTYVATVGSASDTDAATASQLAFPVRRGDLVSSVSSDGSIIFPEREQLTFSTQGVLGELLVSEGDRVAAGDVVAVFDEATVASLTRALAEAEVALGEADGRLAEVRQPAGDLELSQAISVVAEAQLAVEDAREALDDLLKPPESLRLAAEAAVNEAERALDEASEALDELLDPPSADLLAAEAVVGSLEVELQEAQQSLQDLLSLPESAAVDDAEVALQLAREEYDNAQAGVRLAESTWLSTLGDADTDVANAEEVYSAAFEGWLGNSLSEDELAVPPEVVLSGWDADLESIFTPQTYGDAIPEDDPTTPWNEHLTWVWVNLSLTEVVGACDADASSRDTRCVAGELDSAWEALTESRADLEAKRAGAASALTTARTVLEKAHHELVASEEVLADVQQPAGELDVARAETAVSLAEESLLEARETLTELKAPDSLAVVQARSDLAIAEDRFGETQEALAELVSPDPLAVADKRAALDVAEADLAKAEEAVEELSLVGHDGLLIALREAEVQEAVTTLANAREQLDKALLRAPADAVVTGIEVEVDDVVGPTTPIVELVDTSVVAVSMEVDQVDVLSLDIGAATSVKVDALPGVDLTGVVVEIGSGSDPKLGAVTFPVTVELDPVGSTELREGLSATVGVITGAERDVLMVPAPAVGGTLTSPTVQVSRGGEVEMVHVTIGGGDETWAVIESGVEEGEIVLVTLPGVDVDESTLGPGGPGGGLSGALGAGRAGSAGGKFEGAGGGR